MVNRVRAPKTSTSSSLEPDYVAVHSERDFADVIKIRALIWENYSGVSGWA